MTLWHEPAYAVGPQLPVRRPCKLAFVGEAPGEHEVEKLRPLVGPSGSTFNALLRSAGIDRDACLVTNVYEHRLEENDVAKEQARMGADWAPWHAAQVERLSAEIALCQPTVIVPLGGTALNALAQTKAITSFRGQPMMGKGPFEKYKLLPTFHPAFILRQWNMFPIAVGDLLRAQAEADIGMEIRWPKRELYIDPTIEQVEAFLRLCNETNLLSCDIETGWGMIRGVSFAPNSRIGMYVPFIDLRKPSKSYWDDPAHEKRAWQAVRAILEGPTPKLGQNFALYDSIWLLRKAGIRVANYRHDLRLLHKALFPELNAGLAFMSSAYSNQGAWKHWGGGNVTQAERGEKRDL